MRPTGVFPPGLALFTERPSIHRAALHRMAAARGDIRVSRRGRRFGAALPIGFSTPRAYRGGRAVEPDRRRRLRSQLRGLYDVRAVEPDLRFFALAAAFMQSGCAGVLNQDRALAVAPCHMVQSGRIVIEVKVNGRGPFDFALDTGATISAAFDGLREQLELRPIPGASAVVHGAVKSERFPLLRVNRLAVGNEVWSGARVVSLPDRTAAREGIDGILGVDFLQRYAVGFSTSERVIHLYPPHAVREKAYRGWASVPLKPERVGRSTAALYLFTVDIGGREIPALFDLGAGVNLVNWPAVLSLGLLPSFRQDDHVVSGAFEATPVVGRFRVREVITAGVQWRNEVFSVAELEIFNTLMHGERPAAILGAGLFTQRDFIIDFVRNRLLVRVAMNEVERPDRARRADPPGTGVRSGVPRWRSRR